MSEFQFTPIGGAEQARPQPRQTGLAADFANFVGSTLSAAGPEMIGLDPSRDIRSFREENPIGSFSSQALGIALPLVVAPELLFARAPQVLRALPISRELLSAAEAARAAQAPIKAAALREAAIVLPFEAGRVGITAAVNTEEVGNVAAEAAFDLAAIPVAYGAFAGLKQAITLPNRVRGFAARVQEDFPEFDINAPVQHQLDTATRYLNELDKGSITPSRGTPRQAEADLKQLQQRLRNLVRQEVPGNISGSIGTPARRRGLKHIGTLARNFSVKENEAVSNAVDALFEPRVHKRRGFRVRRLVQGERGFPETEAAELTELVKSLPDNFEVSMQYPRFLRADTVDGAKELQKTLRRGLGPTKGNGLFQFAREKGGGAYVIATKVKGHANLADVGDEYLLFKTDRLGVHAPPGMRKAEEQIISRAFEPKVEQKRRLLLDTTRYAKTVESELARMEDIPIVGTAPQRVGAMKSLARRMLPQDIQEGLATVRAELGAHAGDVGNWVRQYFVPSQAQFSRNVIAQRLLGLMRLTFGEASARVASIMDGTPVVNLKNPLVEVLWKGKREGGLTRLVESGTDEDARMVWEAALRGLSPAEAAEEGISSKAVEILEQLDLLDDIGVKELDTLSSLARKAKINPRKNHFLLSHSWTGTFRVPLVDEAGRLKAVASGRTRDGVVAEANEIIRAVQEDTGETLFKALPKRETKQELLERAFSDRDAIFQVGELADDTTLAHMLQNQSTALAQAVQRGRVKLLERQPYFTRPRKGVKGFDRPFTKRDLLDALRRNITARERYKAQLAFAASPRFMSRMAELAETDPAMYKQLNDRLSDFMGIKGPVPKTIENLINTPLQKVMGPVNASRIIRNVNRGLFSLTLGNFDLGYVGLNALTFLQTAMPEMSLVLTSVPQNLQRYYTWFMMPGSGGVRRIAGQLDMFKLMSRSFREMVRPDEQMRGFFRQGILDGTLDPRFVEEFAGAHSERALSVKKLLNAEQTIPEFYLAASEFLPAKSEILSRVQAFSMARAVGRDFLQISDPDHLYRFMQEFTNRTMFLYSQADRPRVMAGAVGGTLGLFKNWTAHYIANMALYAGEGLARKNWKPLLWMMAGTGSVAGIGGLPLYGVADALSRTMTDEGVMDNLYTAFGAGNDDTGIADAMFYGLPALAGVSLQSRGAAPGADFGRDVGFLFSFALMDRLQAGARLWETSWDYYEATGQHPMSSEKFRLQLARAMLPRTMYRALSLSEDLGIRSVRSGNLLVDEQSYAEAASYVLGITPVRVDKLMEVHRSAFEDAEKMRTIVSTLGQRAAEAELSGDSRELMKVVRSAGHLGIADRVLASAKARYRNMTEDLSERQHNDYASAVRRRLLGVD